MARSAPAPAKSVARALEILNAMGDARTPLALKEIARRTGLPESTVHRLLVTLTTYGFVSQSWGDPSYHLGWRVVTLAESLGPGGQLPGIARPHMEALAGEVRLAVSLVVLDGLDVVYLGCVAAPTRLSLMTPHGARFPAYATASGKSLLATLPAERLDALLAERRIVPRTGRTLRSAVEVRSECARIRRRGYAIDDEEADEGVGCAAAAIATRDGVAIAALSVSGRISDLPERWTRALGAQVRDAAARISAQLDRPQR